MLHITIDDAAGWHERVSKVIENPRFSTARVAKPKREDYGALVTYVWDPSGILLYVARPLETG